MVVVYDTIHLDHTLGCNFLHLPAGDPRIIRDISCQLHRSTLFELRIGFQRSCIVAFAGRGSGVDGVKAEVLVTLALGQVAVLTVCITVCILLVANQPAIVFAGQLQVLLVVFACGLCGNLHTFGRVCYLNRNSTGSILRAFVQLHLRCVGGGTAVILQIDISLVVLKGHIFQFNVRAFPVIFQLKRLFAALDFCIFNGQLMGAIQECKVQVLGKNTSYTVPFCDIIAVLDRRFAAQHIKERRCSFDFQRM